MPSSRLTCPSVREGRAVRLHRLTCLTSARFRSQAPGLVSGQLSRNGRLEERPRRPGFLSPFSHRHSLLGHPVPTAELGSPCGRLTGTRSGIKPDGVPDPDGFSMFRTRETWLGLGALYTPGTAVSTRPRRIHDRRLPHRNGRIPVCPALLSDPDSYTDEASSRVSG
jgi:hypothetical protein